jgi:hybrid cluster-associated redox disulfide protein
MTPTLPLDPTMTIDAVMRRWPSTIGVVIRHRMLCAGCPVGIFHTIEEACRAHGVDEQHFRGALITAIGS